MAIELIKIGALPNDGSGDPLRVAFGKINNNFVTGSNTTIAAGTDGTIQFRSTNSLRSIAYYKPATPATAVGIYVAVGAPGRWFTSEDGVIWKSITAPTSQNINQIISVSTGFIAVGEGGTIISSNDAITWHPLNSNVTNNLTSIDYNAGVYTVVGSGGLILTSTDAATWIVRQAGLTTNNLHSVTSRANLWIAVGQAGTMVSSIDSINWSNVAFPTPLPASLNSIAAYTVTGNGGGNYLYTAGSNGSIYASTDGVNWSQRSTATTENLTSIIGESLSIGNTAPIPTVVAVGANGMILRSIDTGITWTAVNAGITSNLNSLSYVANSLYTAGNNSTIFASTDSLAWGNVSIPSTLEGNVNFTYDVLNSNVVVNANVVPQANNTHTIGVANYRFASGYFSTEGVHVDAIALRGNATTLNVGYSGDANLFANVKASNLELVGGLISANANIVNANVSTLLTANTANIVTLNVSGNSSFGNIANVTVLGTSNLGAVGNVHINGGYDGYVLTTDGNSNLTWGLTTTVSSAISDINSDTMPIVNVMSTIAAGNIIALDIPIGIPYFQVNDAVTFTGDVNGGLTANLTYYIVTATPTSDEITVSTTYGGAPVQLTDSSIGFYVQPADTIISLNTAPGLIRGTKVILTELSSGPTQLNDQTFYIKPKTSNSFRLYSDAGLTIPVNTITSPPYVAGGRVLLSEINPSFGGGGNSSGNANIVSIDPIYFTATANGNNQTFINPNLTLYTSNTDITLFLNGSLLENEFYTLSGNALTITVPIHTGDSVDIPRQFAANVLSPGGNGTPGGSDTQLQFNDGGQFGGIPTVTYTNGVISLGTINEVKIAGGTTGQVMSTDGTGNLTWSTPAGTYGDSNVQLFLGSGNLTSNIIPSGNKVYDLGNLTNRFRDIYLSNNTIYLGEAQISASGSNLLYNSLPIASTNTNGDMVLNGNVSAATMSASVGIVAPVVSLNGVPLTGNAGNVTYDGRPLVSTNANGDVSFAGTMNAANIVATGGIVAPTVTLSGLQLIGQDGNVLYGGLPLVSTTVDGDTYISGVLQAGGLTSNTLAVSGSTTIAGNLAVAGNTTYTDVTSVNVQDPIIQLGGGANGAPLVVNDGFDRGSLLHYYTTQPVDAFMGWKNLAGEFVFASNVVNNNNVITINQYGNVHAGNFIGNFIGNFSANTAVTVTANAQPNITSVGSLTGLVVVGNTNLGSNANLYLTGGANGQVLSTDGTGNLSWKTAAGSLTVGTLDSSNAFINSYSNITKLGFDTDSGFDVTDLGNGLARVAMNSTFKFWEVDGLPGITAEGLDTVNFITDGSIQITPSNISTPKSMTFAANIAAITTAVRGNIAAGAEGQLQIAGANNSLISTPKLKFDSTSNLLTVTGNISVAGIETKMGNDTFSRSVVYGSITNNSNPNQKIWGVDANTVAGVDFNIISTDELGGSRQITKLSAVTFGTDIAYNETSTIILNQFLANWHVGLGNGQVELYASPMTGNTISSKMEIIIYNP